MKNKISFLGLVVFLLIFLLLMFFKNGVLLFSLNKENYFASRILLFLGADINAKDQRGYSPIHYAALSENSDILEYIIRSGGDVNLKDANGDTPLINAVSSDQFDNVVILLKNGAELNYKNGKGFTPIMISTLKDNIKITEFLFEKEGITPEDRIKLVQFSMHNSNVDLLRFFLDKFNDVGFDKYVLLIVGKNTIEEKAIEIIKFLFEKGVDVNLRGYDGMTVLMQSAKWNKNKVLEFLLQNKADPDIVDFSGKSAFEWAEINNNKKGAGIIKKFLKNK